MSVYVGNLSYDVTQDDLTQAFAEYGTVKSAQLPTIGKQVDFAGLPSLK